MKKLKLPIIRNLPESHNWLSMDEYVRFVNFNLGYIRGKNKAIKDGMNMRVNVPFSV